MCFCTYWMLVWRTRPTLASGNLNFRRSRCPSGRALTLSSELFHVGPGGSCDVEVQLEKQDSTRPVTVDGKTLLPESLQRDRTQVTFQPDGLQRVEFSCGD